MTNATLQQINLPMRPGKPNNTFSSTELAQFKDSQRKQVQNFSS